MMRFGIVGYGRFGQLWAEALLPFGEVSVYDPHTTAAQKPGVQFTSLQTVAASEMVFVIVPISSFKQSCLELKKYLRPETVIIDCCSVKVYPATIMQQIFANNQPLIATHPLFGPDSVKKTGGLAGHDMVVCPIRSDEVTLNTLLELLKKMTLNVLVTTPEDHDQQMASSQGLVHFIGRGLAALELHEQALATPDFNALLHINKMVVNDTWQLFLDMHRYNPYTRSIRERFLEQLNRINHEVNHADH